MASRIEHEFIGAFAGGVFATFNNDEANPHAVNVATGALLGKYAARLPDMFEPASHPNHRNFFHSWVFLGTLGVGMYKLTKWEPKEGYEKVLKWFVLIAGVAYASHLLRDSITPKGLPLV
ncbi:metal-dependent hydrolase [Kordiimonas lipolytica]|uniref:Metal-dependent hydrolase n=1 Tax=Kordiimonas lipolytica TaxID=1662421 RepID=A0ABV8UEB4_9PROT|nr:metal-dependent hydrolase [Kordiimonas lipolytica]